MTKLISIVALVGTVSSVDLPRTFDVFGPQARTFAWHLKSTLDPDRLVPQVRQILRI